MAQYNVGTPMERIAVDVLGPLPESESGNKYLLIVADYFSKWTEAFPMVNQEATTVAEILVRKVISRFGVATPVSYLHSDQGRNFESTVFFRNVKKTRTTPLHPQSDSMVERFNRTLEAQHYYYSPNLLINTKETGMSMYLYCLWHTVHLLTIRLGSHQPK